MVKITMALLAACMLPGADNPWTTVKEMKSGSELRIFKKGGKQPVMARFDEANDENIIVVVKNEQQAIPKADIDRIDYRPAQTGSRVTKESKSTTSNEAANKDIRPAYPGKAGGGGPSGSSSSGLSIGSKPDFETIYRRAPMLPKRATSKQ